MKSDEFFVVKWITEGLQNNIVRDTKNFDFLLNSKDI